MAFLLAVTYLTFIKGLPYFQKRYPKRIREHPAITSTHFKRRLMAAPDDEIALLTEVKATLEAFQAYVDTLPVMPPCNRRGTLRRSSDLLVLSPAL